jgi:rfaE bifunctional protein kinase chain/domain
MEQDSILEHSLAQFPDRRVTVIGDIMLDHYTFGDVERVSPEAPIAVLNKTSERSALGGAANVAANVAALGANVVLCGVIGTDYHGTILVDLLRKQGIDYEGIVAADGRPTTFKHRFVYGTHHQLLRVDEEEAGPVHPLVEKVLLEKIVNAIERSEIVILSDYAKGLFTKSLTEKIITSAKASGKKVLADIKPKHKELFIGVDLVSPNLKEGREMSGAEDVEAVGAALVGYFKSDVMLTRSENGISVFTRGGAHHHVPGRKIKVADVSGAGDTSIAVTALGIAAGLGIADAAELANAAGAVVVQKPGTALLSIEELSSAIRFRNNMESTEIVPKLWGYEKWIENNDNYCSKLLSLNKGYQCSLHYHKVKDETFIVTKGHVRLEVEDKVYHLQEGGFMRIPPGTKHRFTGIEDSLIIEVSTHHEDSDSYRIEESRKAELPL